MERKTYLGRYRLCVDRIGIPVVIRRSADEATLKADDIGSSRAVAVQVGPASMFGATEREQLEAEARVAQELDHINIPVLRDFGFDDDQLVYVTEYLEGTTAEDWVKAKGPLQAGVALRVASQVASALGAASAQGIIHLAVHPGNIMLVHGQTSESGVPLVKVLNLLGVAPPLPPPGTNGALSVNPAHFASPEQSRDGTVDFRSEVYSLGCTLWFLLKGAAPAGGVAGLKDAAGLHPALRELLAAMLAKNPAERPSDAQAVQERIEECLAQLDEHDAVQPAASPSPVHHEIDSSSRRHSIWKPLAVAAVLAGIAALTAVIMAQRTRPQSAVEFAAAAPAPPATAAPVVQAPIDMVATESAREEEPNPPSPVLNAAAPLVKENVQPPSNTPAASEEVDPARLVAQQEAAAPADTDLMANVFPDGASVEPTPIAGNEPSFGTEVASIETTRPRLPTVTEVSPPAEGPSEREDTALEFSVAPLSPPIPVLEAEAQAEIPEQAPAVGPAPTPAEVSKPEPVSQPAAKKKKTAVAKLPSPAPRPIQRASVGHIFFPTWPENQTGGPQPTPTPPPLVRSQTHRQDPRASVGHIFSPPRSPAPARGKPRPSPTPAKKS